MRFHWIDANDYTLEVFLLFDRWILGDRLREAHSGWYRQETGRDYRRDWAMALSRYPYVARFCRRKAPECAGFLDSVAAVDVSRVTDADAREAETAILDIFQTDVVYAYPEVMEQVNYIRCWNPERLYELADFSGKVVLDVGAGTGRLAFAAAKLAKRVYASEPCDTLREFMRDKIRREGVPNVKVLDGMVMDLPFEDNTFDVVTSGHVVGDDYGREIAEMSRVAKDGGYLVCCNGEDEVRREEPNGELLKRGFQYVRYETAEGGIVFNYWKQVCKEP